MNFNFNLSSSVIIALATCLMLLIYIIIVYVRRIRRVTRAVNSDTTDGQEPTDPMTMLPASVIVYAQAQSSWLEELLPGLLAQDYPAGFEVIVVNDGASEATRDLVENLALAYPNLYLTYTPDGARNLSRKKLGITIGVKAAKHDVVVMTDAATIIDSPLWLQHIMANYNDSACDVVLGYAYMSDGDKGLGKRRRAFDFVADSVTWLTSALAGKPYRGTQYNIAYTRDLFFNNKGFSRSLNLENGDDDIFISEIARPYNTVVELSTDSMVMANYRDHTAATSDSRHRHHFTGARVSKTSRRIQASGEWALWLMLLAGLAGVYLSGFNLFAIGIAALLFIIAIITVTATWRGAMKALKGRRLRFSLPWLIFTRPIRNLKLDLSMKLHRTNYYTWKK